MPTDKTRIGPRLLQENGFLLRETLLRVEPTVDLFVREKWLDRTDVEAKLPVIFLHGGGMDGAGFDVPVEDASLAEALVITGDLDPFATESDVAAFLHDVGTPAEKAAHLRQRNVGHMPYVEAGLAEVQQAINAFVDATTFEQA